MISEYEIPAVPVIAASTTDTGGGVFGVAVNGVPFESHGLTLSFDSCAGHSGADHMYHYHAAPLCLLQTLSLEPEDVPLSAGNDWLENYTLPEAGSPSPVIGFALDGFPIYALYDDSGLVTSDTLDECNGKIGPGGNYAYWLISEEPYFPQCLKGEVGTVTTTETDLACQAPDADSLSCFDTNDAWAPAGESSDPAGSCDLQQEGICATQGAVITYQGYLADTQCFDLSKAGRSTPDGVDVLFFPEEHTVWCMLLPVCRVAFKVLDCPHAPEQQCTVAYSLGPQGVASAVEVLRAMESAGEQTANVKVEVTGTVVLKRIALDDFDVELQGYGYEAVLLGATVTPVSEFDVIGTAGAGCGALGFAAVAAAGAGLASM